MLQRRSLLVALSGGAVWAASAKSYARIMGANERIRVAIMGVNGRGVAHMSAFTSTPNTVVTHLIDVDSMVLEKRAGDLVKLGAPAPRLERDYRRLLDNKSIDVLSIATPDHWHAKAALDGLAADKHVYLEKPCGIAPYEGEALVKGQQRHGRILQMGNQQRSSLETRELVGLVRDGVLGETYAADTWYANNRGSIGIGTDGPPPPQLDWELWQGPCPRSSYRSNVVPYNWHWFWRWGTGEICNNGLHELDIARWILGVQIPERVSAIGARRFYKGDDWEMYDTMRLELTFPGGKMIRWDGNSCNAVERYGRGRGVLIYGTKGSALVDRNGYEIFDLAGKSLRIAIAQALSGTTDTVGEGGLDKLHVGNFTDLIRGKTSVQSSPISEGHISTLLCHLGNMSYRTGKNLVCEPGTGRPTSADAMAFWTPEYQSGWELRV